MKNKITSKKNLPIIAITMGDPAGIGPEVIVKALRDQEIAKLADFVVYGAKSVMEEAKKRFGTEKAAERLEEEGKAALVCYSEKIALLTDSLTMCKNIGLCMDILNLENASKLLTYGTGINYTPDYLIKILGDSIEREYRLNQKFGLKREDDTLPERFTKEPLLEGPTRGSIVNIQKMV